MSITPPVPSVRASSSRAAGPRATGPRASDDPLSEADAGDGVHLTVEKARGAQRSGAIWILAVSLTLTIVALAAFWLSQAPKMQAVNHPSGRDLNVQDVRNLYKAPVAPAASPPTPRSAGGI